MTVLFFKPFKPQKWQKSIFLLQYYYLFKHAGPEDNKFNHLKWHVHI